MGSKRTSLGYLPGSVRESLIDCVSETAFDQTRFDALVGEHHVGLSNRQRKSLLDEVYERYVERHPEEPHR